MGRFGVLFASASVLAFASPALAQEAVDEAVAEESDNVIIVTAQKRSQDIIEVPVAVSAFSDSALQAANINDFADITRVSPSLTINGAANNNEATIALRGIGTFSFSISVEPSVSVDRNGLEVGPGANTIRFDRDPIANNKPTSRTGTIDLDLGFATLTSVTGLQYWDYQFGQDVDGTNLPLIFQTGPYASEQFSQELRLTSPSADGFEYMFGLFYADASTDRSFVRGLLAVANWDATASTTSYAAFTQLSYDLGPYATIIGGGRLNHEEIAVRFEDRARPMPVTFTGADSDTAATWRVALQHFVAPDVNVFASLATGYKGQAYDVSTGFTARRASNPVSAETSVAYEVGIKRRVIDNRLSFALTGFWTDYNDFQAQSAVVTQTEGSRGAGWRRGA